MQNRFVACLLVVSGLWFGHAEINSVVGADLQYPFGDALPGIEVLAIVPYEVDNDVGKGVGKPETRLLKVVKQWYVWKRIPGYTTTVFWVLDCSPTEELEESRPVAIVESGMSTSAADIVLIPSRKEHVLVLAGTSTGDLTINLYLLDLKNRLTIKPFSISGKLTTDRPKSLSPIATHRARIWWKTGIISALRTIPDSDAHDCALLVTASSSQADPGSFPFRYSIAKKQWAALKEWDWNQPPEVASNPPLGSIRNRLPVTGVAVSRTANSGTLKPTSSPKPLEAAAHTSPK